MATLHVKVVPGSSRSCIAGRYGDALKVKVAAAAEKGKANHAVIELLARTLGVKSGQIVLVAGHTNPRKTFQIEGIEQGELDAKLAQWK
jgi:uncharacterized protein (TIGR00251 family)